MELIKSLIHFLQSFGFLPSAGNDIQQGETQALSGTESKRGLPASFECPNFSPSGEREPLVFCNTPDNRSCWFEPHEKFAKNGFDINTDYETHWPDGSNREFWLNVTNQAIWPDGYYKPKGKVVNGTYPGPLIEVCWGDNITIHVTNYMVDNGTTLHWHGFRQLNTSEADGANGITQCPIAPGHTYTYKFRATEYGHTWYHSHYSLQYPDGVLGPMIIHGPQSANYDVDVGTVLVSDWSHETAFIDFFKELNRILPPMQSTLLNGKGRYPCAREDPRCISGLENYFTLKFEYGKRYLLRLINTSTESQFKFEIDNHNLTVVSADFVPIHPYNTKYLNIGIGQRYSVIVTAIPSKDPAGAVNGSYWIRTIPTDGCSSIQQPLIKSGTVRYSDDPTLPISNFWGSDIWTTEPNNCADENMKDLVPVVVKSIPRGDHANNITDDTYEVGFDEATTEHFKSHGNYTRWDIAERPMWLDWGNPTILNVGRDIRSMSKELAIIPEDYVNKWVILVIVGNLTNPVGKNAGKTAVSFHHPMHLHGHDFLLLAQNDTEWDTPDWPAWKAFAQFNYTNPTRRDVALLPKEGYIVIAFKTDNPGTWLLHCHIPWHASSGLALQIMENQKAIEGTIRNKRAIQETCEAWEKWNSTYHLEQDDSGV